MFALSKPTSTIVAVIGSNIQYLSCGSSRRSSIIVLVFLGQAVVDVVIVLD